MDITTFERLVAEVLDAMPERVLAQLDNVAFLVEPRSEDGERLGEYRGVPRVERHDADIAPFPDQIVLYHEDIVDECEGDPAAVREEVERTLWHEIAHHLGWDDDVLHKVETKKGWR